MFTGFWEGGSREGGVPLRTMLMESFGVEAGESEPSAEFLEEFETLDFENWVPPQQTSSFLWSF